MTVRFVHSHESEHWIKVSGQLTVREFQKLQSLGELSLEGFGQFEVLIELEDFQGWIWERPLPSTWRRGKKMNRRQESQCICLIYGCRFNPGFIG
jgi:hypothetical protein